MTEKLSRQDWIDAGLRRLASHGADGLSVAGMARELGATKGSFYWHFSDLPDFRQALLTAVEDLAEAGLDVPDNADRPMIALIRSMALPEGVEPAFRALALHDPETTRMLERIDRRRIAAFASVLERLGKDATKMPHLLYAAWLGAEHLAGPVGMPVHRLRAAAARMIIR